MPVKQVIVMRKFYNGSQLRKGKLIAQGSHASCSFLVDLALGRRRPTPVELEWLNGSFAKICLSVDTEEELLDIFNKAHDAGLVVKLITDSGKTEFHGVPTITCLAIGPDLAEKIDPITSHLGLL